MQICGRQNVDWLALEEHPQPACRCEAERGRRAKVIHAEGELQASEKLAEAAKVLSQQPQSMQLRYLQTLNGIATEQNSTIVFPLPIDFFSLFQNYPLTSNVLECKPSTKTDNNHITTKETIISTPTATDI